MNKAVFLDRDGVINKMVFNDNTGEFEPPHTVKDLEIFEWVYSSLHKLSKNNYYLFLISNQPDYAKGKTSLDNLYSVHNALDKNLIENKVFFKEYFYCYHHPDGIVKEYSIKCKCRKPGTFFVDYAIDKYEINRDFSWLIGDRESDIQCGKNAKLKTIFINEHLKNEYSADFSAENLEKAVNFIISNNKI
jgi:D-glycero-D-manno-heptose 1,7-bisphosphate phosphatase